MMGIEIYEPKVGDKVMVYWGYGLGFRQEATGLITRVFEKSVRVKLLHDVQSPHDHGLGWCAGFTLYGIPKNSFCPHWQLYRNGIEKIPSGGD